jgi:hypothetical protein
MRRVHIVAGTVVGYLVLLPAFNGDLVTFAFMLGAAAIAGLALKVIVVVARHFGVFQTTGSRADKLWFGGSHPFLAPTSGGKPSKILDLSDPTERLLSGLDPMSRDLESDSTTHPRIEY